MHAIGAIGAIGARHCGMHSRHHVGACAAKLEPLVARAHFDPLCVGSNAPSILLGMLLGMLLVMHALYGYSDGCSQAARLVATSAIGA